MFWLLAIFSFVFGTIIGSFLNVVIYRLPKGLPLTGRSICPNCNKTLGPAELVPLFSFLFLGQHCKNCKIKISWRYFTVESITGFLFLLAFLWFNPQTLLSCLLLAKVFFILSVLVVIFAIDYEHFLILDKVLLFSGVTVLVFNLLQDALSHSLTINLHANTVGGMAAALAGTLPFFLIWLVSKGEWMGFGDVKLMLFLGLALGWSGVWVALFLGIFLGGIVSIILLAKKTKTLKSQVPLGTFLSVGAALAIFFAPRLISWYLGILGF